MAKATTPAHRVKSGPLEVAVWANESKTGAAYFSVTASRSYKTGDKWSYTSSFGFEDLALLEKLLAAAWTWIHESRDPSRSDAEADSE